MRLRLYRWFKREGRDLPWRRTSDPYAILVSEFMSQQTTVAAVVPYFHRWMERFPTVQALAEAEERDVLHLWQGLGYYSRARNLHRAAKAVMAEHGGVVPKSREALRKLPGVGDYTAAAVASFAFDQVEPVIDANIARVLARLGNWQSRIDDTAGKRFLEKAARDFLPAKGGALHTSAVMELGALVCVPRRPRCLECPVNDECRAENPETLPVKKARPKVELVKDARAFILEKGRLWLEPSAGPRWKGMWVLPAAVATGAAAHVEVYPITRYQVTMSVYAEKRAGRPLEGFPPDALPPMPSPHRRAVAAMLRKRHTA